MSKRDFQEYYKSCETLMNCLNHLFALDREAFHREPVNPYTEQE